MKRNWVPRIILFQKIYSHFNYSDLDNYRSWFWIIYWIGRTKTNKPLFCQRFQFLCLKKWGCCRILRWESIENNKRNFSKLSNCLHSVSGNKCWCPHIRRQLKQINYIKMYICVIFKLFLCFNIPTEKTPWPKSKNHIERIKK